MNLMMDTIDKQAALIADLKAEIARRDKTDKDYDLALVEDTKAFLYERKVYKDNLGKLQEQLAVRDKEIERLRRVIEAIACSHHLTNADTLRSRARKSLDHKDYPHDAPIHDSKLDTNAAKQADRVSSDDKGEADQK